MKFMVSTKPLSDGLNLAIVNANVTKFYRKSCLAQITAHGNNLTINVEAPSVVSEIRMKGGADDKEASAMVFVDSLLLKQLVSTFESPTTTLEFTEGGLILHSGKSKFTLPKLVDGEELSLSTPREITGSAVELSIDKADWKFIKENQMFAIAMSFTTPVYTKVWVGQTGDVLVGDFDSSLFTHSEKSKLGDTCLLSDTIINLFNSLPDGAKLVKFDNHYLIHVATDGFEFASEFSPEYEEDIGSYNSDMILSMMEHPDEGVVKINTGVINKFLSQADLLSTSSEDVITLSIEGSQLTLHDNNVDCNVDVIGSSVDTYSLDFKTELLKSILSNYTAESVSLSPIKRDDNVVGIIIWSDELTTVLAGVD